jgi:pyridoxamine 5'-phosphate oxidase
MSSIQPPWSPEVADPDPVAQFSAWFADAKDVRQGEPEAMALATVTPDGWPAVRWVLLKSWDERGFVFYSNERSAKGSDLDAHPAAALGWRWYHLERQVRVVGSVSAVAPERSDEYFASRPRGSQIGAWASEQSSVIADRASLEARIAELEARYEGHDVPRPPHWRGFSVEPTTFEFWQGRRDRIHDRVVYRRPASGDGWERTRLSP